jgi:hypothetical protein
MVAWRDKHDAWCLLQDFIGCFTFNLKELGQLTRQEVQIVLEEDNPIFKRFYKFSEVEKPWFKLKQNSW